MSDTKFSISCVFAKQFPPRPWVSYWDLWDKLFTGISYTDDVLSPVLLLPAINYHRYRYTGGLVPDFHQFRDTGDQFIAGNNDNGDN
jgi:hypothetical protein